VVKDLWISVTACMDNKWGYVSQIIRLALGIVDREG